MKIKVLHIIKSLGRGGAEMLLAETLRYHDQRAFEFHYIYFLPWKDQLVETLRRNGGEVICLHANNNIQLILQAKKIGLYIRENNIQVVHAHLPWAGIVSRLVKRMIGTPVIYTEHNKQERYHFVTRFMNRVTMGWLNCLVAVSDDVRQSVFRHKPSLKIPVHTILNGVNVEYFRPDRLRSAAMRETLHIPPEVPVIGTVAVFRFQKRLDIWLDVASRIAERFPQAHFIIVGDGPLKGALMEKLELLGPGHRIHFAGLQTNVRPYLSCIDIFMMSSVFEGLPVALLEAMAAGCAIVSTDAGGIPEVIRDGVDGLLCSVDEPMRLADMACSLIERKELRLKLAAQARTRVEESFSMKRMVLELEDLYRKMLSAPNP